MTAAAGRPVVMLTSSYPRFPGDGIGTFLEPIAHGVAALGHDVHVVAPWHPDLRRPAREGDVRFRFYRYAPTRGLHVFGYAAALRADVSLRPTAYLTAPLAVGAGGLALRQVVRDTAPAVVHAHWVVPGGVMATMSRVRPPLVVSLHGSDVFVAEKNPIARLAARLAFRRADAVTACSEDLRRRAIALGASEDTATVVPYGVDTERFAPAPDARTSLRARERLGDGPVAVAVGRLVRKKGFEYLIDAVQALASRYPTLTLVLLGDGDLRAELEERARRAPARIRFPGAVTQDEVARWLTGADVVAVPSVRDDAGNVDGLPNVVLEAMATGTPVVTTRAGGIDSVARDGETARLVPERDPTALAAAIAELIDRPTDGARLGEAARALMRRSHGWDTTARRFETAYETAIERAAAAA